MKNHCLILILLTFLSVGFISADAKASLTIATFADPSEDSSNPLFAVDFINMNLNGEWPDTKTGLILEIPYSGHIFENAWFDMNEVTITSKVTIPGLGVFGQTGPGRVNFYQDGNSTDQLVVVDFDSGFVSFDSFGADNEFTAENVTITGSEITGTLSEEEFTFNFANLAMLPNSNNWDDGFTATAAFTSSAIPEPATVCLFGLGALSLFNRKKNK
jgi:hypothetical protein